ncbi:MAG: DEAD/DEAH box helicase, partial [Ferruginibacter sp.]|nr:DEAD/DEAH box helicase [Ferruginibacter sp.]
MKQPGTSGFDIIQNWLLNKNRNPFLFQQQTWEQIVSGKSGLVNAPTGFGKTFAVFLGAVIQFINEHPEDYKSKKNSGLQLLWISPLRALAKDIGRAMDEVIAELGLQWQVAIRNGDTPVNERQKQKRKMPEVLIITPESLHLLLAQKGYPEIFKTLKIIAVDEWHELLGSKRGVLVELAIAQIFHLSSQAKVYSSKLIVDSFTTEFKKHHKKLENTDLGVTNYELKTNKLKIWGISATIGNLEEAKDVLLSSTGEKGTIITAIADKKVEIASV